jgi:hypothetical protein
LLSLTPTRTENRTYTSRRSGGRLKMSEIRSEEDIQKTIQDMDYVIPKAVAINPSYYKLKDETIVKAFIDINHLIPDPNSPDGYAVSSTNIIMAYVPKDKRNPALAKPYNLSELKAAIIDEDMEPIILKENFSIYELSNGLIMSIKAVAGQISKTKHYNPDGEPVYIVNIVPIVKLKKNK